ncbi:MAG: hypothetical protein K8F25_16195 [Fimbriimonadaceae bacterium]|nr:hypothetical protein [Alphaproteobacteria bacterium]
MSSVEYSVSEACENASINQRSAWTSVISTLAKNWIQRQRKRNEYTRLLNQDPKLLEDIGVTRLHLLKEVRKPFWRA